MSSTTLTKIPGVWRSYVSRDGEYTVYHSQNANIWRVSGGPESCYPLPSERVFFRTLAECRREIVRRESTR